MCVSWLSLFAVAVFCVRALASVCLRTAEAPAVPSAGLQRVCSTFTVGFVDVCVNFFFLLLVVEYSRVVSSWVSRLLHSFAHHGAARCHSSLAPSTCLRPSHASVRLAGWLASLASVFLRLAVGADRLELIICTRTGAVSTIWPSEEPHPSQPASEPHPALSSCLILLMCGRTCVLLSLTNVLLAPLNHLFLHRHHAYSMLQDLYNDDVGNAALFLTSDLSRVITGTTM